MKKIFCVLLFCIHLVTSENCFGNAQKAIIAEMQASFHKLEASLKAKSATCTDGWKEYNQHCYYFGTDSRDWHSAESVCRQLGGYLAKVTDSKENAWIKSRLSESKYGNVWIGGADVKKFDWRWVLDFKKFEFTDWQTKQPDNGRGVEGCVEMRKVFQYKWNDYPCSAKINYVCESHQGMSCIPYSKLLRK